MSMNEISALPYNDSAEKAVLGCLFLHLSFIKSVLYRTVLNRTVLITTISNNRTKFSFLTITDRTRFSLRRAYEMEA